jgi:putative ABC transport system permease protein
VDLCAGAAGRIAAKGKNEPEESGIRGTAGFVMKYLPLLWAGLWRKPSRAVLMLLQIMSAFLLFGLLQGLNSGVKQAIAKTHKDRLIVGSSVSLGDPLPISQLSRIQSISGVKEVSPIVQFPGQYQRPGQTLPITAVDVGAFFKIYSEYVVSRAQLAALEADRTGAIIGSASARRYGLKVGDRLTLTAPPRKDGSNAWSFDIVGTFDVPGDEATALIVNYDYVNEARFTGQDTAIAYLVLATSVAHAGEVGLAIDNAFANSSHETRTQSEGDMLASQLRRIADLDFIVRGIVGAVFIGLLLATCALMMQSIRERTPELAVLKTVGFSDTLVMVLIIAEAVLFCLFAAGIGLGIASFLLPEARQFIGFASMPAIVIAAGAGFAVLLALMGSALPAASGLRLQVAQALADR